MIYCSLIGLDFKRMRNGEDHGRSFVYHILPVFCPSSFYPAALALPAIALPPSADLCGERGEYHSFVYDGPIFRSPVPFRVIRKYYRDYPAMEEGEPGCHRYWYLDIG